MTNNNSEIAKLNDDRKVYCSIQPESNAEKAALFNALEACDHRLNDEVGKTLQIKDAYIQEYEKVDATTGEPRKAHRTILFDHEGHTHVTASNYLYVSVAKIMDIWGTPDTWSEPLTVKVIKKPVNNNREALSLQIVENKPENVVDGEVVE